jgi:hypothetical protein
VRVVAGSNPATPTNQIPNKINRLAPVLIESPIIDFTQLWGILWGLRSKIRIGSRIANRSRKDQTDLSGPVAHALVIDQVSQHLRDTRH